MRNLHVVIASTGRATCSSVALEAVLREARLSRITIVAQGGRRFLGSGLQLEADRRGVQTKEVALPEPVGPARARHLGAMEGDEEFIGFLDDDIIFDRGSLSNLVDLCQREGLGGASGVVGITETSAFGRWVKRALFRSIFRDPRADAARARRPVPSDLLSGGMTVYRRTLYEQCAGAWVGFSPRDCGEDVELSFCVSRHAGLAVDPSVRVQNASRDLSVGPPDPARRAMWHLDRYRSFATRHATSRRHWAAYLGVLVGVLARGVGGGARFPFVRAVLAEGGYALRQAARPVRAPAAAAVLVPDTTS